MKNYVMVICLLVALAMLGGCANSSDAADLSHQPINNASASIGNTTVSLGDSYDKTLLSFQAQSTEYKVTKADDRKAFFVFDINDESKYAAIYCGESDAVSCILLSGAGVTPMGAHSSTKWRDIPGIYGDDNMWETLSYNGRYDLLSYEFDGYSIGFVTHAYSPGLIYALIEDEPKLDIWIYDESFNVKEEYGGDGLTYSYDIGVYIGHIEPAFGSEYLSILIGDAIEGYKNRDNRGLELKESQDGSYTFVRGDYEYARIYVDGEGIISRIVTKSMDAFTLREARMNYSLAMIEAIYGKSYQYETSSGEESITYTYPYITVRFALSEGFVTSIEIARR